MGLQKTHCGAEQWPQHQLASSTLRTLEQRLSLLEEEGRFECAYALRMEVADWLLGARDANLSAPSLS